MRLAAIILLLLPITYINAQKIGELAPEKPPEVFPENSWGVDIMFGEGGFGLGTFFRKSFNQTLTGFVDLSISESKDERETEFFDVFTQRFITPGKKNRVFQIPVNFGLQYRIFENVITENLRPYFNMGVGPTLIITTPYNREFFNAFGKAQTKFAAGGYVGFGANFGLSKSNLFGINLRYYFIRVFGDGVENLNNKFRKDLGGFFLTVNVGILY